MTTARQRQKKLEKKNKKRKLAKKAIPTLLQSGKKAAAYAKYPIHECLVPDGLFDIGIGEIVVTRKTAGGDIALSAFILDVFFLGVKNALCKVMNEHEYNSRYKKAIALSHEGREFNEMHPACVKKLIGDAVYYAEELGFPAHKDYKNAKGLLDGIDPKACPVKYQYGQDNKPFYIQGPHETPSQVKKILGKLHSKCGEDGYHYTAFFWGATQVFLTVQVSPSPCLHYS